MSTFQKYKKDRAYQSINESMTKFKGRCSFMQCLPLKPVKRNIKVWMRCDTCIGYRYDMNVYAGRKEKRCEDTVGECVVFALTSVRKDQDNTLAFDRYITSVHLMDTLLFAAVRICIKKQKTNAFACNNSQDK